MIRGKAFDPLFILVSLNVSLYTTLTFVVDDLDFLFQSDFIYECMKFKRKMKPQSVGIFI